MQTFTAVIHKEEDMYVAECPEVGTVSQGASMISGRTGSHVRLSKVTPDGKVGTVVPMHKELKIGTLKGILKLAKIDEDEFSKNI
jgi:hypothetical protein